MIVIVTLFTFHRLNQPFKRSNDQPVKQAVIKPAAKFLHEVLDVGWLSHGKEINFLRSCHGIQQQQHGIINGDIVQICAKDLKRLGMLTSYLNWTKRRSCATLHCHGIACYVVVTCPRVKEITCWRLGEVISIDLLQLFDKSDEMRTCCFISCFLIDWRNSRLDMNGRRSTGKHFERSCQKEDMWCLGWKRLKVRVWEKWKNSSRSNFKKVVKGFKEGIFGETFAEDQVDACQVLSKLLPFCFSWISCRNFQKKVGRLRFDAGRSFHEFLATMEVAWGHSAL